MSTSPIVALLQEALSNWPQRSFRDQKLYALLSDTIPDQKLLIRLLTNISEFQQLPGLIMQVRNGDDVSLSLGRILREADEEFGIPADRIQPALSLWMEALGVNGASNSATASTDSPASPKPGEPQPGEIWTEPITGMEFVWVPGGKFMMGSPETEEGRFDNEGPQHKVELDGFWMGKYPVTQAQWQKVMGSNPSNFKGDRRPVETVNWEDAQRFIVELGSLNKHNHSFFLPSEAQWEYACRAGTSTRYNCGDTISMRHANFDKKYEASTTEVGKFPPNAFGLHDMHGNVWEWCEDVYDPAAYNRGACKNPLVLNGGSHRVLRGGCWDSDPGYLRSAYRYMFDPGIWDDSIGFRLLRTN